jgi:two-component system sensor histidine kinase TctE
LIDALNRLFGRIGSTQDGQRRFIENAAHQLRTPLAGLQGQVELAVREASALGEPAGGLADRLERIEQATSRVTRLANQLLTLSRSDRPTHDTAGERQIELAELVTDLVAIQIDRAIDRDQDLGAETQLVSIRAIEWELRELLSNLIDNAIRYTPRGGRITVRCGPDNGGAFIEVEDSGPGIPAQERDRVFERFYRAPTAPAGGSGLGLSIVREIASLYEARVEISDSPRASGTVVRVLFPEAIRQACPSVVADT